MVANEQARVYRIPVQNLGALQARIEKLNKRAAKLGCVPIALNTVRMEDVPEVIENIPTGRILRFHHLTIDGQAPRVNGWQFIAKLQHVAANGENESINLLKIVPGYEQDLPTRFRFAVPSNCDHCRLDRRRSDTFVLRSELTPDTYKQVGRNCLIDFLGHTSPEAYAAAAELIFNAGDLCGMAEDEDFEGGGWRGRELYQLDWFLEHVSAAIRIEGWLSRTNANLSGKQATVDSVIAWTMTRAGAEEYRKAGYTVEDSDRVRAAETLEWMRGLSARPDLNDYLYNLSTIAGLEAIDSRMFGLAGSAVATWAREQEKEIERRRRAEINKDSQHFGTIGKREVFTLTLEWMRELEGNYGVTYLQKFRDQAGNVAVWFGSNTLQKFDADGGFIGNLELGETATVKATVKEHNEREGIKQTILSRVALFTPKTKKGATAA